MQCVFDRASGKCAACGEPIPKQFADVWPIYRECQKPCPHLGAALDATALVPCETCQGNVRLKLPVYACALHGRCVPSASTAAEDGTRGCVGCADRF